METFAKNPMLAKLLRELKLTPVWYHKKSAVFSLVCLQLQFVVFPVLCCGTICKWVFFANTDVFFYWLA